MSRIRIENAIGTLRQTLDPRRALGLDDTELLRHMLLGDSGAFETLVHRHATTVANAARQVLSQTADIEDVVQATFLVLYQNGHRIREARSLSSWLFGVAHRLSVHQRSRRLRREQRERVRFPLPETGIEPADLSWREALSLLHEEIDRLPERLRKSILLCHFEGKSRDEAASVMGISVGAVKGLLERGRDRLRHRLERRGFTFSLAMLGVLSTHLDPLSAKCLDSITQIATGIPPTREIQELARGATAMKTLQGIAIPASILLCCVLGTTAWMWAGDPKDPPKDKPSAVKEAPPAKTPAPKEEEETVTLSGKVLGADGKPRGDVALYGPSLKRIPVMSEDDIEFKEVGRSQADGSFRIVRKKSLESVVLMAKVPGMSSSMVSNQEMKSLSDLVIRLLPEFIIRGRLIDTEGKPVGGGTYQIIQVMTTNQNKLDDILEEYKRSWNIAFNKTRTEFAIPTNNKIDDQGRFEVNGVPEESIVVIQVSGKSGSKVSLHVITRKGFNPEPFNTAAIRQVPPELRLPGQPPTLYGPEPSVVIPLGKTIEGVVTDVKTGKPIAGVEVRSGDSYSSTSSSRTDAQGKYRLVGLTKAREYLVHAYLPQKNSNYLPGGVRVKDQEGYEPIRNDMVLAQGIPIEGRILERGTDKLVDRDAYVRIAPLKDNPFFDKPGNNYYSVNRTMEQTYRTGHFRMLGIPGKNIILVQIGTDRPSRSGSLTLSPYLKAKPDAEHRNMFQKFGDDEWIATAGSGMEGLRLNVAYKIVDLPEMTDQPVKIDVYCERGRSAQLKIVDSNGKPVNGFVVSNLADGFPYSFQLPTNIVPIAALDPAKPRQVKIIHAESKTGAIVTVRGDEKEAIEVQLAPLGTFKGRILDIDGQPRAGIKVGIQTGQQEIGDLYRDALGAKSHTTTDEQGNFQFEYVLPGIDFNLELFKGREYYIGEPRIGMRRVESGKINDIGEHKTRPIN